MVTTPTTTSPESQKRQTNGFLETISAILALFARRASRKKTSSVKDNDDDWKIDLRASKSPLAQPKKLLSNISSKAMMPFGCNNQKKKKKDGWGNGGVWQKEILMGGKCEPLDFSGVIYYDINGKQTREIPLRSPRASPLPGYLTRPRPQEVTRM